MATEFGFQYFDSAQMPSFTVDDFADAYHLNRQDRIKLSSFLSEELRGRLETKSLEGEAPAEPRFPAVSARQEPRPPSYETASRHMESHQSSEIQMTDN